MKAIQLIVLGLLVSVVSFGQVKLENQLDSVSYSLGADIGANLKKSGADKINLEALSQALKAALEGEDMLVNEKERMQIIRTYFKSLQGQKFEKGKKEGELFLAANKKKKGVKVTESGLQYIVLKEGEGEMPTVDSKVKTHYKGTLIDGTVFDSSYDRGEPIEFPVNGVIKGWTEALLLMKTGAKWKLFIPSNLAYGERGAGGDIPPNSTLIFEIELLEVINDK